MEACLAGWGVVTGERRRSAIGPAIRLEQCFSLMLQTWSGLVRPAGGETEQEQPEPSLTRFELPLTRDGSPNPWSWS